MKTDFNNINDSHTVNYHNALRRKLGHLRVLVNFTRATTRTKLEVINVLVGTRSATSFSYYDGIVQL